MRILGILRRVVCSLAVALAAALLCPVARASRDTVPDWVRAAVEAGKQAVSPDAGAVVLLDQTTLSVSPNGTAIERHRRVLKILSPKGREEGMIFVPFDQDTKILGLHAWSIAPDGREYAVQDKEVREVGYPGGGNLFEDLKVKVIAAPGRDPGGIIAYECEQRLPPYLHEDTWSFQSNLPSLHQTFTLELPPNFVYRTVWAHHEAVTAVDLEHGKSLWDLTAIPAVTLEHVSLSPSLRALSGRMTVDYAAAGSPEADPARLGRWRGIGEWYEPLAKDRLLATPEISTKAAELTAGKTDFADKAEAVSEFVQKDIRYFVIERGIGGLRPHAAGEIFHNRYGDCKDKATLLSAMLGTVGIHSALMMVDTRRGVVDPEAPSQVGNHMIAAIEIPKGYVSPRLRSVIVAETGKHYLIFDPTWEKTAFGQLEHGLQGGYGVLMEGAESEIVHLPVLSPELNTIRRSGTVHLAADGTAVASLVEKRFGDLSESARELALGGDRKEQDTSLNRRLSRDFAHFEVSSIKVVDASSFNKDLTTTFDLSAERYARATGSLLMVRPRVFGSFQMNLERKARVLPIDLKQTRLETDDFILDLPDGYVVDELPDAVKLDVGFATYQSASKVEGNHLHYTRSLTVRDVSLPAVRYGDLEKLADTIAADEQNNAVLKKK